MAFSKLIFTNLVFSMTESGPKTGEKKEQTRLNSPIRPLTLKK